MNLMGLVPPKALIRFLGHQSSMDWHELEQFWGDVSEISP